MNRPTKTKMNIRQAARFVEAFNDRELFDKKNTAYTAAQRDELWTAAHTLNESRKFITAVTEKEKISVDTFRYGFIGKAFTDEHGSEFVQTRRGKPYGYVAAVMDENKKIYAGYTFLSKDETFEHPVIGQAIALRKAIENRKEGITFEQLLDRANQGTSRNVYLNGEAVSMFRHYYDRVRRYFLPEVYSFSRGSDPILDPNYADIHCQQFAQLAIHAKDQDEFERAMRHLKQMIHLANPSINTDVSC